MAVEIPLTHGHVATVDEEDADLAAFKWCAVLSASGSLYARRALNGRLVYLHVCVLSRVLGRDLSNKEVADHVEPLETLNNRRSNLRLATYLENARNRKLRKDNRSGLKGVGYDKRSEKYRATITIDGRKLHLGMFISAEEAHAAYVAAALKYFGKHANDGTQSLAHLAQQES